MDERGVTVAPLCAFSNLQAACAPAWCARVHGSVDQVRPVATRASEEHSSSATLGTLGGRDIVKEEDVDAADYYVKRVTKGAHGHSARGPSSVMRAARACTT